MVMREKKPIRSRWLTIRLSELEEAKLAKFLKQSISQNVSEYARKILLREPVIIVHRNQSADDFLKEMIVLRNELNSIGKNFNQAVHKLHTLDHFPDIKVWATLNEASKDIVLKKIIQVEERLQQIYELWSQK